MRLSTRTRALAALLLSAALVLPSVAEASEPLPQMPLIAIDPGHGGIYSNANSNGLREKNVNLAIALELRNQLQAKGYRVIMTRTTDRSVGRADRATWNWSNAAQKWTFARDKRTGNVGGIPQDDLQARCDIANRAGADLFICIHNNGAVRRSVRGTESYGSKRDRLGRTLARLVHNQIVAKTGLRNRGVFARDFYVARWTNMPAILVEAAFISNRSDAALLKSPRFRAKIAAGVSAGIDQYFAAAPITQRWPRTTASSTVTLAAAVSRADFPAGSPVAVIARTDTWAETAGAAALAKRLGGPLLMVDASGVASSTAEELARLRPASLVTVGLTGSFDASRVAELASASAVPTTAVTRIEGADRNSIAAAIAAQLGVPANGHVLIADGQDMNAVLPAAAVSAKTGAPLLLTSGGVLSAEQQAFLDANRGGILGVALVGSAARVPSALAAGASSARYSGPSAASIAAKLNARYYRGFAAGAMRPLVADTRFGGDFLVAAGRAARRGQPLVPVTGSSLPELSREFITNRRSLIGGFEVLETNGRIPLLMDHLLIKSDFI